MHCIFILIYCCHSRNLKQNKYVWTWWSIFSPHSIGLLLFLEFRWWTNPCVKHTSTGSLKKITMDKRFYSLALKKFLFEAFFFSLFNWLLLFCVLFVFLSVYSFFTYLELFSNLNAFTCFRWKAMKRLKENWGMRRNSTFHQMTVRSVTSQSRFGDKRGSELVFFLLFLRSFSYHCWKRNADGCCSLLAKIIQNHLI